MHAQQRLHSIDNLRAVMMWLGIVLHVAELHDNSQTGLPWRDSQRNALADFMVFSIHTFRMPAFFIVAGYFVALLVERRGVAGMVANRLRRVGLPLLIFWPVLFTLDVWLATQGKKPAGSGFSFDLDLSAMPLMADGSHWQLMHLWFLQILLGLALSSSVLFLLVKRLPPGTRSAVAAWFGWFAASGWAFVALAVPLAWISRHRPFGVLSASALVLPGHTEWIFNGMFLGFGVGLYHARDRLLPCFERRCWWNLAGGTVLFCADIAFIVMRSNHPDSFPAHWFWISLIRNACGWLWCFALIGIFSRYLPRQTPLLSFAAQSSYWVYLVHIPILVTVHLIMRDWPVGALTKMLVNITATSAVCLLSYPLFVRHTSIGLLLNGHR